MLLPCSCLLLFYLHLVLIKMCQIHNPIGQREASLQLQGQLSHEAHQALLGVLKSTIKRGIKTASLSYPFGHDCGRAVGSPEPFPYQTGHTQVTLHSVDSVGGQSDSLDRIHRVSLCRNA